MLCHLTQNQIIKSIYHLFASLFLLYLSISFSKHIFIKSILILLAFFHAYDTWWFFTNDGNAPI